MGRGTTAPTAWSGTELGLPLLSRAGGRSVFPCPRLAFGEELKGKITGVIPAAAATSFAWIQFQMELLNVPKPALV